MFLCTVNLNQNRFVRKCYLERTLANFIKNCLSFSYSATSSLPSSSIICSENCCCHFSDTWNAFNCIFCDSIICSWKLWHGTFSFDFTLDFFFLFNFQFFKRNHLYVLRDYFHRHFLSSERFSQQQMKKKFIRSVFW